MFTFISDSLCNIFNCNNSNCNVTVNNNNCNVTTQIWDQHKGARAWPTIYLLTIIATTQSKGMIKVIFTVILILYFVVTVGHYIHELIFVCRHMVPCKLAKGSNFWLTAWSSLCNLT